jgi:hypothetical protein
MDTLPESVRDQNGFRRNSAVILCEFFQAACIKHAKRRNEQMTGEIKTE